MRVVGVILAGGLARRMGGGDKPLLPLAGRPVLAHVVERARPQVDALVLNANGDPGRFAGFGLPVVADTVPGFPGPLAGILAGMEWAAANAPEASWLTSFACDSPLVPLDLVARLREAVEAEGAELARAASDGHAHPVFGLWPVRLATELRRALVEEEMRRVTAWAARYRLATVTFPLPGAGGEIDPFLNLNTQDDLALAEDLLRKRPA